MELSSQNKTKTTQKNGDKDFEKTDKLANKEWHNEDKFDRIKSWIQVILEIVIEIEMKEQFSIKSIVRLKQSFFIEKIHHG